MTRIVKAQCPHCGAGLRIDQGLPTVTCSYCAHSSIVEWKGVKPSAPAPRSYEPDGTPYGRIQVSPPFYASLAALFVLVGGLLATIGLIVGLVAWSRSKKAKTNFPAPTTPIAEPSASPIRPPFDRFPIQAEDLSRMDVVEVIRQADDFARSRHASATLTSVVAHGTRRGMVDATTENAASIHFAHRKVDSTMPAGKDVAEGQITVHVSKGALYVLSDNAGRPGWPRLDFPACSSSRLWRAVVETGLPDDAVASIMLYDNRSFTPKSPTVWSIRVPGHPELRREVDAQSCKIVKNWGGTRMVSPSPPEGRSQAKRVGSR